MGLHRMQRSKMRVLFSFIQNLFFVLVFVQVIVVDVRDDGIWKEKAHGQASPDK